MRKTVLLAVALVAAAGLVSCGNMGAVTRATGAASWFTPPPPETAIRTAGNGDAQVTGLDERQVEAGGQRRTWYAYVPQSLGGATGPLVIAFHGGGGEPLGFAERAELFAMADRHGFVLALPEGIRSSWAHGGDVGYADRSGVDDLAFIDAIIADAGASLPVDPGRTFAMGMSAGGMMTYRAACELPGRFRAIAVVAGTLAAPDCSGGENVSVLHIHGTADESVPLAGGAGEDTARRANYRSVASSLDIFETRNACSGSVMSTPTSDTTCQTETCAGGGEVEFCAVQNGGHGWPGSETNARQLRNGDYISPYFDATEAIASFFEEH
jgi:polyhydroxybutyrate depolymerase